QPPTLRGEPVAPVRAVPALREVPLQCHAVQGDVTLNGQDAAAEGVGGDRTNGFVVGDRGVRNGQGSHIHDAATESGLVAGDGGAGDGQRADVVDPGGGEGPVAGNGRVGDGQSAGVVDPGAEGRNAFGDCRGRDVQGAEVVDPATVRAQAAVRDRSAFRDV